MSKLQRNMAVITVAIMKIAEHMDFLSGREDDPIMPAEYYEWADPKLWRASCVRPEERRM